MLPRSGRRTPSTHSIVVVFPAPFGPIKPKTSPSLTSNETSETATVVPYLLWMPETWMTGPGVPSTPTSESSATWVDQAIARLNKGESITAGGLFENRMPPYGWRKASVVIRSPVNAQAVANLLRAQIAALDPMLPITIETMNQKVSRLAQRPKFNAVLLGLFAGMGVMLAAIGLYGLISFLVAQRTQEIGVRMALGATPGQIAKLVLAHAARWT